jgi:hypothetical protein
LREKRSACARERSTEQTGIAIHADHSPAVNVGLKVGAVSEQVTVEASPITV